MTPAIVSAHRVGVAMVSSVVEGGGSGQVGAEHESSHRDLTVRGLLHPGWGARRARHGPREMTGADLGSTPLVATEDT